MAFGLFFFIPEVSISAFFLREGRILSFLLSCLLCIKLIYPLSPFLFDIFDQRGPDFFFFLPVCSSQMSSRSEPRQTLTMDFHYLFPFLKKHWRFLHPAVLKRLDCRPLGRSEVCGMWSWSICFQVWTSFRCVLMTAHQFVAPVTLTPSCRTCVNQKSQQGFTFQTGVTDPNHPDAIFNKTEICCLPIKYWQNLCILTFKM